MGFSLEEGFTIVGDIGEADISIINTCGFIESAREEAYLTIKEVLELKKEGSEVIITGCMAKLFKKDIESRFSVPLIFLKKVLDVKKFLKNFYLSKPCRYITTPSNYAYVKISDGCINRCSYCLIPSIRGSLRSRDVEDIVSEVRDLLEIGIFEIILTAQNLGDYGKDSGGSLKDLLSQIFRIEKDFRVRLLYLYPGDITDELIGLFKRERRLCRYIDMPIQHVSCNILKRMKRKISKKKIEATIKKLRDSLEDVVIRTTLMVGFPGEGREEFEELVSFLKRYRLDHVGIFAYSRERGTVAYSMDCQVSLEEKERRLKRLYDVQKEIAFSNNKRFIKKRFKVFIEGEDENFLKGRFYGQAPDVDPLLLIKKFKGYKVGSSYNVEVVGVLGYDLLGEVL